MPLRNSITFIALLILPLLSQTSLAQKKQPTGFMLRATPEMKVRPLRGSRSAFVPPVKGVDATLVFAEWNDLQPEKFGPIKNDNIIDKTLAAVAEWNQRNPEDFMLIRLRTFAGIYSPDWVFEHAGSCKIDYRKKASARPVIRTTPKFWTPQFKEAWLDLQQKLAAKYDGNPLICDVSISGSMTLHSEVMWRQPSFPNVLTSLRAAGLNEPLDIATLKSDITLFMETWRQTPVEMTFNTQRDCTIVDGKITKMILRPETTQILLDHMRTESKRLNKQYMIGNHSLSEYSALDNKKHTSENHVHHALKNDVTQHQTPLYFQTEVFSADIVEPLISEALIMGASLIELPNDITNEHINSPALQQLRAKLKSNSHTP